MHTTTFTRRGLILIMTDTDTLEADVQLRRPNNRPVIYLWVEDHPLVREQKSGITMARVHDILKTAMPRMFPRAGER